MKRNQDHRVVAVYQGATLSAYRGNPLIEALPPINSFLDDSSALKGSLRCTAEDIHRNGIERAHSICRVIDDFFSTPQSAHTVARTTVTDDTAWLCWKKPRNR